MLRFIQIISIHLNQFPLETEIQDAEVCVKYRAAPAHTCSTAAFQTHPRSVPHIPQSYPPHHPNESQKWFLLRQETGGTRFSTWHSTQQPLMAQNCRRETIYFVVLYHEEDVVSAFT